MTRGYVENPYVRRLRRVPALRDKSVGELRAVAQVAECLVVPAGAVLATEARPWRGVYLVADGSITYTSSAGAAFACGGACVRVDDGATVVAVSDSTVFAIAAREWRALRVLAPGVAGDVEARAALASLVVDDGRELGGTRPRGAPGAVEHRGDPAVSA